MTGFLILVSTIVVCITFLYSYNIYNRLTRFKNYQAMLDSFIEISYEKIYKEQILIYSASEVKPDARMKETIIRDAIKLLFEIMGSKNEKLLSDFYGDRQTLITNIILLLNSRLDSDEILEHVRKVKNLDSSNKQ